VQIREGFLEELREAVEGFGEAERRREAQRRREAL